jgi:drug/metabolite transporter (DMT)-like permease
LLFAVLGLIWGTNFVSMKWAAATISAGQITLLRVLFGFLPVAIYAWSTRACARTHLRHVHHFVVMSVLATSGHYFAFAAGTALLPSGIAGALAGVIPLFSLVAAFALLPGERPGVPGVVGVLVGLGGVVLIARPWAAGGAVSVTGVLWMALGSAAVGLSFVYAKRFLVGLDIPPAALTTYQFGIGLVTLAAVTDLDGITALAGDPKALAGLVVGLGLLGSGLAYILYYVIVERLGAVTAAGSTYLPPVVALAIGWLLVDEPITPFDGLAAVLILAGVAASATPRALTAARRAPLGLRVDPPAAQA